jgi:uncharacterized protein YjbI with pentapeptide repeats
MVDLSSRAPVRVLSPDEIERMLAEHRLYLETEYHQGHRASFSSVDLKGRDFSGLNLRGRDRSARSKRASCSIAPIRFALCIDIDMVEERGELFLLPLPCG